MKRGENTLLIWVLSWAAVLLGLLYSPLGSPDLYSNRSYFTENQGVNFNKVVIYNAPTSSGDNQESELSIPLSRDVLKKNLNYAVNSIVSPSQKITRSVSTTSTRAYNKTNTTNTAANASAGISEVANGARSVNSSKSSSISGTIGVGGEMKGLLAFNSTTGGSVVATDSTVVEDTYSTNPRQKADENGVPVGDGWSILAILAVIYGVFKAKKAGYLPFKKNYSSQILSKE